MAAIGFILHGRSSIQQFEISGFNSRHHTTMRSVHHTHTCPPTSQTVNVQFSLRETVSTLKPFVGVVVTVSFNLSLYNIVVFPAESSPSIKIFASSPRSLQTIFHIVSSLNHFTNRLPMVSCHRFVNKSPVY